jgi:hypothetical protein
MLNPLKKPKIILKTTEKSRETTKIILGKKGKNYIDYSHSKP